MNYDTALRDALKKSKNHVKQTVNLLKDKHIDIQLQFSKHIVAVAAPKKLNLLQLSGLATILALS